MFYSTKNSKKLGAFILLMGGILFAQLLSAQNCSPNKVWACRLDECGFQECKCINTSQVQNWTAQVPVCNWKWHVGHGGTWRIGQNETGQGIETSLHVFPNPVSSSTTISFSLEQSQNVSLRIFDTNGKLITILADESFEDGAFQIVWDATDVSAGIYFLQIKSTDISRNERLIVTKN